MRSLLLSYRCRLGVTVCALLAVCPEQARAQVQATESHVTCVGGAIGCSQVDFFLQFIALPADGISVERFTLSLLNTSFRFSSPGITESEDALGFNFYSPSVSGDGATLAGIFDFTAFVHPELGNTLRIRAEMETVPPGAVDASALSYAYALESGGEQIASGGSPPVTATPEPGTMLLVATGVGAIGVRLKRRARRSV